MDLFSPEVPFDQWHQNFKMIWMQRNPWNECVLAEWALNFTDRDDKFVKEFQTTFNSSFWELYLFACLKEMRFAVDFSHTAPDFVARRGDEHICIEAAIASNPDGYQAEWEGDVESRVAEHIDRRSIVERTIPRLTNTLVSKHRKFMKQYSTLPHVKDRAFIVAIAPFDQPMSFYQTDQAIRNVLYQYDLPIYQDIPEENRRIIFGHEYLEYILKPNGSKIELGFFLDDRMKEISAVIFSNVATWGKVRALSSDPNRNILFESQRYNDAGLKAHHRLQKKADYRETLLDGLHVLLNPHAQVPIPPAMLNWPRVAYHTLDSDDGVPVEESPDGFLFWRTVLTLPPEADVDEYVKKANENIKSS